MHWPSSFRWQAASETPCNHPARSSGTAKIPVSRDRTCAHQTTESLCDEYTCKKVYNVLLKDAKVDTIKEPTTNVEAPKKTRRPNRGSSSRKGKSKKSVSEEKVEVNE